LQQEDLVKRHLVALGLLLLASSFAFAQLGGMAPEKRKVKPLTSRELVGQVTDKAEAPLAESIVYLKNTKTLTVKTLVLDNGLTAAQVTELEAIDDVNEMRARAAEMKAERLQAELEEARKGGGQKPGGDGAGADPKQTPRGMRGDPAGSGSGGGSGTYDASKFKGTGDVAGQLRAKREAGEIKYETIPTRGRS